MMSQTHVPARISCRHLWVLFAVSCFLLLEDTSPAAAQVFRPAVLRQTSPAEEKVTPELVESRRKVAADSADLTAEQKTQTDTHYKTATEALQKIAELQAAAKAFKQNTDNVEERVRERRQRSDELQKTEPEVPSIDALPELEQARTNLNVQLTELKTALTQVEAEPVRRANRLKEIRTLLLSASQRVGDINKQLASPPPDDEPPLLTQARTTELHVQLQLIEAEVPALQNEGALYETEDLPDYSFVRWERDVLTQEVALAEKQLELFDGKIDDLRAKANDEALRLAKRQAIAAQPLLKADADLNQSLAEKAVGLNGPIEDAKLRLAEAKSQLEDLQKQFTATQQKVENIGLTGPVGALLRRQKTTLPDVVEQRARIRNRRTVVEEAQYDLFSHDDQRRELASRDLLIEAILNSAPKGSPEEELTKLDDAARIVLDNRAEYLDQLIQSYNTWLDTLFELDETEQLLVAEAERYATYIDERVLWIRSNRVLFEKFRVDEADGWLLSPGRWANLGVRLLGDIESNFWLYASVALAAIALILLRSRFCRHLADAGLLAERGTCTSFEPTLIAAWLTVLLSVLWPGLVWFLAMRIPTISDDSGFIHAVGRGLMAVAWGYLPLEVLLQICRPHGLADHHFDWPDSTIRLFRRTVPRLAACGLPLAFVTATLYASDSESGTEAVERLDSVERAAFVATTVALALFLRRVMRADSGILCEYLSAHPAGWMARLKFFWYWGSVLSPLCLAGLTIAGFYYTAQQLAWRLFTTILFVLSLQLVRAFLQRLLIVQRRRLSIEQARKRREQQAAREAAATDSDAPSTETSSSPDAAVPLEELHADVQRNTEQSRRLLSMALTVTSLVGVWMIWVDVLPALRMLDQWPLWTTRVEVAVDEVAIPMSENVPADTAVPQETIEVVRPVTPRDVGLAILLAIVTFACARNIPGLMEMWVLQRLPLDQSVRYAITTLTRYVIILLGIVVSFNAMYVGWSKVQWLATALTFGLGFGLQEIFANFVAGLILLFERPIRIGDVVTVDDISGVVSRIRIRATTITNWDRKEYVIPNKEFITGRMLNWTLTDKVNRVVINVGVAYGSDIARAKELLLDVCRSHPLTLESPGSSVTFSEFGDNTLNLIARTYLPDLDNRLGVIDALHTEIDTAFRSAGIEIAFPQQDLHLRSVDESAARMLRDAS